MAMVSPSILSADFAHLGSDCRAVLDAGINRSPEQLLHLLRLGGGRDIPVFRRASQHSVPDAAANGIGFMPGFI